MTSFNISVDGLTVRPVQESDLIELSCKAGDLQTFDYIRNRNPAARRFGSRAATASSAAHMVLAASSALNRHSLTVWVRRWLRENRQRIHDELFENDHHVFILMVNYTRADNGIAEFYMGQGIHLLGTVPDLLRVSDILTNQRLYGPQMYPTPPNNMHRFQTAYLVGQGNTGRIENILPRSIRRHGLESS
jgi:hypothetical protein